MTNWPAADLQLEGIRLHYYRTGGAHLPFLFVHGFTDNALYWTRTVQSLEGAYDIVMYDARGHGLSERAGGRFSADDRVADLVGLVGALQLNRPGLIGHSMGAATIALAAARYPDLARFVILEDPAWFESPQPRSAEEADRMEHERAESIRSWRDWVVGLQTAPRSEALAQVRANSPLWSEQDANLSLDARLQFEIGLFADFPPPRMPWREQVVQIQCPLLLITGEVERGGIISPETAQDIIGLSRAGHWVQVNGAGHSIRFDQFESYLAAVKAFLRQVDGAQI